MRQKKEYEIEIGGKKVTAIFSDLAEQAHGSVMLSSEGTVVLATVVISRDGKENRGFFNLTVEYMEKFYASGKILGSQYVRREGRPSDQAILAGRMIDRTIRPLFPHHIKNAVQVIVTVLAVGDMDPKILGVNATSIALGVSQIPWAGPVGAVHISKAVGDEEVRVCNYLPAGDESPYELDVTICGKDGNVCMIEAMTYEWDEEKLDTVLDLAVKEIGLLETWQRKIISEIGKEKLVFEKNELPDEVRALLAEKVLGDLAKNLFGKESKKSIIEAEGLWGDILDEKYGGDENSALRADAKDLLHESIDELVHKGGLEDGKRVDLRKMDEVREIYAHAGGLSPSLHGTGTFYRGETHVLSIVTLGGPESKQEIDGMESEYTKRFMHHYNFPPYSSGETGRVGGLNRREMGHGMLAEKALVPVIPNKDSFPYTIRVVSECMASNGSTSQASICASSIALMDAGVPISRPVAGIAMGLLLDEGDHSKYKILTDIQGPEDHHGDMDFKVAGTRKGVTAIQMDIKLDGVPPSILKEALRDAKKARLHILDVMEKEISEPRSDISPRAPKISMTKIPVEKIGMVIGSGGKTVNEIREKTGAEISIEDDGTVYATGRDGSADKAIATINSIVKEWKEGEVVEGTVVKILEIGAVVKISEYSDGLVHISEISPMRVEKVSDVLKEGMIIPVKVIGVDKEKGRISLSIKALNKDFVKQPEKTDTTEKK